MRDRAPPACAYDGLEMTPSVYERAEFAARSLLERAPAPPRIALVLGSGLGGFAESLAGGVSVPFAEIPHFPHATVAGHRGRMVLGAIEGTPVAVMQGRVHGYEGYAPEEVTFPVRVLARMGTRTLIVTNAAGGIRADLKPGELVLLSDHINFTGRNPLAGENEARFGPRFFDMTEAYSRRLRLLAQQAASAEHLELAEGVYLGLSGPSYETPAEIRAFRTLGADLVGMSTVHEVIVARHMGMEVLGISCVTNLAAGVAPDGVDATAAAPIVHEDVMETGRRVEALFTRLLLRIIPMIAASAEAESFSHATR